MRIWNKIGLLTLFLVVFASIPAFATPLSSIESLKDTLIGSLLPVFATMSLGFAAFQFFTGNQNAKQSLAYAITGSVILFAAQSIIDLLTRIVK